MLIQSLPTGPLDIVGDVHGEIEPLRQLLELLGYDHTGHHPQGRRLVFLGDLTDRGPDSPAVIRLVKRLVEDEVAQCALGNHDLNLLLGKRKHGNAWFFQASSEMLDPHLPAAPQTPADEDMCATTLSFFRRLPLVLERPDLRVVHACWEESAIDLLRRSECQDAVTILEVRERRIEAELTRFSEGELALPELLRAFDITPERAAERLLGGNHSTLADALKDDVGRDLAKQNWNPIKLLTSGPECRATRSFYAAGKERHEARVAWWDHYADDAWCVFGHYGRVRLPGEDRGDHHFDDTRPYAPLGKGRAMCVDFSIARRWAERFRGGPPYRTALVALRWPERWLYFDTGRPVPCE